MRGIGYFSVAAACLLLGCAEDTEVVTPPVRTALENMKQLEGDVERAAMEERSRLANEVGRVPGEHEADVPQSGTYEAEFVTTTGSFTIRVHREWAPRGAHRFYQLVKAGFYDDCGFFRVVPDFMVQFGIAAIPSVHAAWNTEIADDPVKESNTRGRVTFATSGPDSRTSQVFINFKDNSFLDSQGFAPFGEVVKGMDSVDKISSVHGEDPQQPMIESQGNTYLKSAFPSLDYVKSARITLDDQPAKPDADQTAAP
ncbi:MAG: peptidylprolyl isomerase [Fuerstiella sp.]